MSSPVAARPGWHALTANWPWFKGEGRHPIAAYSEYMPLPSWTQALRFRSDEPVGGVRFLLTFHPFPDLPAAVQPLAGVAGSRAVATPAPGSGG